MLLIVAVFLNGCRSSTVSVRPSVGEGEYTYAQMNEDLRGQYAVIELEDGKEVSAKNVKIVGDSVSWLNVRTDEASIASIRQLHKIVIKNHPLGALEGLGFGLMIGGGVGALAGLASAAASKSGEFGSGGSIAIGLIIGGGIGALVGVVPGVIAGHSYNYEFPASEQSNSGIKPPIEKSDLKADIIYLKNGNIIRGTIISEDYLKRITIRNLHGEIHTYDASEVERVEKAK